MAELTGEILYGLYMKVLERLNGLDKNEFRDNSWNCQHHTTKEHFNQLAEEVNEHISKPERIQTEGNYVLFPNEDIH